MDEEIDLPKPFADPGADAVRPDLDPRIVRGMEVVGDEPDESHRRRQLHMQDIPPACRIGDHRAYPQLAHELPGVAGISPDRSQLSIDGSAKPIRMPKLHAGPETPGQIA